MDRLIRGGLIILSLGLMTLGPGRALASARQIELVGPVGLIHPGDQLRVDLNLTNLSQAINAVDLTIRYPADRLQVSAISREQSALTLWPEAPRWDNAAGTAHLVGGLPNGLYAKGARMATLLLTVLQPGPATVTLDAVNSTVLLNDGLGTKVLLPPASFTTDVASEFVSGLSLTSSSHPDPTHWSTNSTVDISWTPVAGTLYSYQFSTDISAGPDTIPDDAQGALTYANLPDGRYSFTMAARPADGSWSPVTQRLFFIDATPPEPFVITQLDPSTVGGQSLIAWTVIDRMSGVVGATLHVRGRNYGAVISPLKLSPDWRGKNLTITVADQAGNTQTATWTYPAVKSNTWSGWFTGGVLVGLAAVGTTMFIRRHRR